MTRKSGNYKKYIFSNNFNKLISEKKNPKNGLTNQSKDVLELSRM